MRTIESREYKVMLDHRAFSDRKAAAEAFLAELAGLAASIGIRCEGKFAVSKKREVVFLDSSDHLMLSSGLLLRRRSDALEDQTELTLKCRSEDRYIAAGAVLAAAAGLEGDEKFEEDIAAPFRSRFSHSNQVRVSSGDHLEKLADAAAHFPSLAPLQRDGLRCRGETALEAVNGLQAFERVLEGPELTLPDDSATLALILWSNGPKGRPLVAEFSFRIKDKEEQILSRDGTTGDEFLPCNPAAGLVPPERHDENGVRLSQDGSGLSLHIDLAATELCAIRFH